MKKRSLFVATAMLLVAVIVATSATYAWFTNVNTAKATVSMGISEGTSLQISADEKQSWVSTFKLTEGMWVDASIAESTDNNLGELYRPTYDANNETVITGYHVVTEADNVISQKIYFRSTKQGNITFTDTSTIAKATGATIDDDIMAYAQILVVDGKDSNIKKAVYATSGGTEINGTISGTGKTDVNGSYTPVALQGATNVVTMTLNQTTGYYEGEATFYFFIEGTKTNNLDLMGNSSGAQIVATLEFGQ